MPRFSVSGKMLEKLQDSIIETRAIKSSKFEDFPIDAGKYHFLGFLDYEIIMKASLIISLIWATKRYTVTAIILHIKEFISMDKILTHFKDDYFFLLIVISFIFLDLVCKQK